MVGAGHLLKNLNTVCAYEIGRYLPYLCEMLSSSEAQRRISFESNEFSPQTL